MQCYKRGKFSNNITKSILTLIFLNITFSSLEWGSQAGILFMNQSYLPPL